MLVKDIQQQFLEDGTVQLVLSLPSTQKYTVKAFLNKYREVKARLPEKLFDAKIEPFKAKRSNDANAYMWCLCDKIALVVRCTQTEIYRSNIAEYGVFSDFKMEPAAVREFSNAWSARGTGYFCKALEGGSTAQDGLAIVRAFFGSSSYDTAQMARLIDGVVQEAKSLDIETKSPAEIADLKDLWGRDNNA